MKRQVESQQVRSEHTITYAEAVGVVQMDTSGAHGRVGIPGQIAMQVGCDVGRRIGENTRLVDMRKVATFITAAIN